MNTGILLCRLCRPCRKYLLCIYTAIFFICVFPVAVSAKTNVPQKTDLFYVADYANVLKQETINDIVSQNNILYADTGAQIALLTIDSLEGTNMNDYAYDVLNTWGVGSAGKNNGVLLLLSIRDGKYCVLLGKGLESSLTGEKLKMILDTYLAPDFTAKNYDAGVQKIFSVILKEINLFYHSGYTSSGIGFAGSMVDNTQGTYSTQKEKKSASGFGTLFIILGLIVLTVTYGHMKKSQGADRQKRRPFVFLSVFRSNSKNLSPPVQRRNRTLSDENLENSSFDRGLGDDDGGPIRGFGGYFHKDGEDSPRGSKDEEK